jgi:hypothetical protein
VLLPGLPSDRKDGVMCKVGIIEYYFQEVEVVGEQDGEERKVEGEKEGREDGKR